MDIPQCGNLAIFQLLWFCMKIILADFKRSKTVMWTISEALNFVFLGISHLKIWKISTNSKFRVAHMVKMEVFGVSKWPKLISRGIWVAEISWNFHIVSSQLGCQGLYILKLMHFIKKKSFFDGYYYWCCLFEFVYLKMFACARHSPLQCRTPLLQIGKARSLALRDVIKGSAI